MENKKEGVGRTIVKIILVSIVWLFLYYFILELLGEGLHPSSDYKLVGMWVFGQIWIIFHFFQRRNKLEKSGNGWTWIYVLGAILGVVILWSLLFSDNSSDVNSQTNPNSQVQNSIDKAKDTIVWVKYSVTGKNADGSYFESGGTGSGVIVGNKDNELTVYTNRHVVDCMYNDIKCFQRITEKVEVRTQDGKIHNVDKVSFSKSDIDLAILSIKTSDSSSYSTSLYTPDFKFGERVTAIGYPSYAQNVVEFSIKEGEITNIKDVLAQSSGKNFRAIESDVYTYFGSSGGGLFDMQGNLIGINTWGSTGQSIAIDFSSIGKEEFIYCNAGSYFSDGACYNYCEREQVLGTDGKCYDVCDDYYCKSEIPQVNNPRCTDPTYVLGDDGYCHQACTINSYCPKGVCYRNQCATCSDGNSLWEDGKCRVYQ